MVRAIDSEVAFRFLTEQIVKETGAFSKGVNKGLNIARSAIRNPDAIPTLTPPNEWVSVEESLPNDKQIVLFRQKNGFIYCAEYFAGNSLCSPSWFIDCDCWEAKEVTHWMPLPTPPDRRPPDGL